MRKDKSSFYMKYSGYVVMHKLIMSEFKDESERERERGSNMGQWDDCILHCVDMLPSHITSHFI